MPVFRYRTVPDIPEIIIQVVEGATDLATGTGKAYFTVPSYLNNARITSVHARVVTAGTTNASTFDVNINGTTIFSTNITIDSAETSSSTAATPYVINQAANTVVTNDLVSVDIDSLSTTVPKGLIIRIQFQLAFFI